MTDQVGGWTFSKDVVECTGFGGIAGRTFDSMECIAREAAQNCLGARDDASKPITVELTRKSVPRISIPYIDDYKNHLIAAKELIACNPNTGNITDSADDVQNALRLLEQDELSCLTIRDSNTVGLEGGHGESQGRLFRFLASTGISQDIGDSAGSHGLGKNSLIAGSSLGCFLFFSRTAWYPQGFFSGRCEIGSHFDPYRGADNTGEKITLGGTGYLVSKLEYRIGGVYPFIQESQVYPNDLSTSERGTCITIPGFRHDEEWLLCTMRAIVSGFNLAIHQQKIEFRIKDELMKSEYEITRKNLVEMTEWCIQEGITRQVEGYRNLTEVKKKPLGTSWGMTQCLQPSSPDKVYTFEKELELVGATRAVFYHDKEENRLNNKYFVLRRAAMNIYDKGSGALRGFGGYIQCLSEEGNKIIKGLEDPTHTGFRDASQIRNKLISAEDYRRVRRILETFARECLAEIKPVSDEMGEIHDLGKFLPSQRGALQNRGNNSSEDMDGMTTGNSGVNIDNEEEAEWKPSEKSSIDQSAFYEGDSKDTGSHGTKDGATKHKKKKQEAPRPRDNQANEETGLPSPQDVEDEHSDLDITINDIRYKLFKLPKVKDKDAGPKIGVSILPCKNGVLSLSLSLAAEKTDSGDKEVSMDIHNIIRNAFVGDDELQVDGSKIVGIKCRQGVSKLLEISLNVSTDYAFYLS